MVECNLAKVEVAGSNPVSRSIYKKTTRISGSFFFCLKCRQLYQQYQPRRLRPAPRLSVGFPPVPQLQPMEEIPQHLILAGAVVLVIRLPEKGTQFVPAEAEIGKLQDLQDLLIL